MRQVFIFLLFLFPLYSFCLQDKRREILELSWQSFVYSKQLENAYNLSKKAVKLYPNEIIWLERLAQICVWTGRIREAADMYEKIYTKDKNSPSLLSNLKILKTLKTELYLEISKQNLEKNFSERDFMDILSSYVNLGEIKKAMKLANLYGGKLKTLDNKEKLSFFYLKQGEIKKAEILFSQTSKNKICKFTLEKAKFYFLMKQYHKAADILEKNSSCKKNKDYAFFFSDLMFFIGEYDKAAKISETSISEGFYRQQDAEIVFNYYFRKDKPKAAKIAALAYKKFREEHFLYFYMLAEEDKKAKKLFLDKEVKEEKNFSRYYFSTSNEAKPSATTKIVSEIKNTKDLNLTANYLWNILDTNDTNLRESVGNYFNCVGKTNDLLYLPLAYLKSSYGAYRDALYCFKMDFRNTVEDIESLSQYSDFLRNAGFYTEADFYARKSYMLLLKENKKEFTAQQMRLYLMFSNLAYFPKKLEKSKLSETEKLDLKLSYLYQSDLKANAIYLTDTNAKKAPKWANFLSIYEKKEEAENFKASAYSPQSRDLANLYIQQGKINMAKYQATKALNNSPDETQNHILWRSLFINKNNENGLYYQFENKNFAQSVTEGARFIIRDVKKLKIAVQGENERMNFFPGHGFSIKEKNYSMFSIISSANTWNIKISRRKRMEDFYSLYFQKDFALKKSYISFSAGLNEESKETFSIENAGKVDFFSQKIHNRFSSQLSAGLENSFYNYKDQKDNYAAKASLQEIYLSLPKIGLRPYIKIANYNKTSIPTDSTFNSLYRYQNPLILPKSFWEVGLNTYFFNDKGLSYSSRWEYPLSISISYNLITFINYFIQLNLKTFQLYRNDANISITYAQGASLENSSLISCHVFINFR